MNTNRNHEISTTEKLIRCIKGGQAMTHIEIAELRRSLDVARRTQEQSEQSSSSSTASNQNRIDFLTQRINSLNNDTMQMEIQLRNLQSKLEGLRRDRLDG